MISGNPETCKKCPVCEHLDQESNIQNMLDAWVPLLFKVRQ